MVIFLLRARITIVGRCREQDALVQEKMRMFLFKKEMFKNW